MQSLLVLKCSNVVYSNCRFGSTSTGKSSLISRIRYVLNHYWLGSKLLYQNSRAVQQIKNKDVNQITRHENFILNQFRYDIRVGIPFVTLFALPIIGYTAPLVALIAPKYLPSTLIMPTQQVKFLKDDATASSSIIPSLIQYSNKQFNADSLYGIVPIMQFINQVSHSNDRYNEIISSIPSYSSLFNKYLPLSELPREHLLLLHRSVLHSSFVANYLLSDYSLEYQLDLWQYQTLIDDNSIQNLDNLSVYELVQCLYSRGLYLHLDQMAKVLQIHQTNLLNKMDKKLQNSIEKIDIDQNILNDWKILLEQWIQIHQKLSKFNPISTSFILHVAPLLTI